MRKRPRSRSSRARRSGPSTAWLLTGRRVERRLQKREGAAKASLGSRREERGHLLRDSARAEGLGDQRIVERPEPHVETAGRDRGQERARLACSQDEQPP